MQPRRFTICLAGVLLLATALWPAGKRFQPTATTPSAPAVARAQHVMAARPLTFELNQGQTDPQVRFLSRGSRYALFLTSTEAVLLLEGNDVADGSFSNSLQSPRPAQQDANAKGTVLRMKLTGANPRPRAAGLEQVRAKVNYFIGNDATRWRRNVPVYAKVKYESVYPGVDLVYYGNQQQLEYDFLVAPGADPGMIALEFEGADKLEIDAAENLLLRTGAGTVRQQKPVVYQEIEGRRAEIDSAYVLLDRDRVGFKIGRYDPARPLVIDPVIGLGYSSFLGGSLDEEYANFSNHIAVDAAGLMYVTGATTSTDFPTSAGAFDPSYNAGYDVFVAVLTPDPTDGDPINPGDATDLLYSTYLGGTASGPLTGGTDRGFGIAVDPFGKVYVVGSTSSRDFPTTLGAFDLTLEGPSDAFVAVLAPNSGTSDLVYSSYLGGGGFESGLGIAVDSLSGIVAVTGATTSGTLSPPLFPTTSGAFDDSPNGFTDAFVTRLLPDNTDGDRLNQGDVTDLLYSTYLGGIGGDIASGVALGPSGGVTLYVTGLAAATFPTTSGAFDNTHNGADDAFIVVLTADNSGIAPDATDLSYSTYFGGNSSDRAYGIAVDGGGRTYVTGFTTSTTFSFPTTSGAFDTSYNGGGDGFVAVLMPDNTGVAPDAADLHYSTYLGGGQMKPSIAAPGFFTGEDGGRAIAVFELGAVPTVYVTGYTSSISFPTPGGFDTSLSGLSDAFVAKLLPDNADGQPNVPGDATDLVWATYLGGIGEEVGSGIAVDARGRAYVRGWTSSPNFPTTAGAFSNAFGGGLRDAFVAVIQ